VQDELPDAVDIMRGGGQPAVNPNSEPDAPTWLGRRIQDVRGKQDPRYQNLPNISAVLQKEGGHSMGGEIASWMLGAGDQDMSKSYQAMLGRRYIGTETDANGYPIIVYRGQDGKEARAYVNNPGLDAQDVGRGLYGALPFAKAGQVVAGMVKGAPLLGRMFAQAGGQAATSVAQDAAAVATGVSDFDPEQSAVKAGVTAAGGAGGELLGAALSPIAQRIAQRRYYDANTGQLTEEGMRMARAAGADPQTVSQEFATAFSKALAGKADPEAAFREATGKEFGIRRSIGEITGNRERLLHEQQMRGGTLGQTAREAAEKFDKLQQADIEQAVRGVSPPGAPNKSIAETIAPTRKAELARTMGIDDTGSNIGGNTNDAFSIAREGERKAWEAVPKVKATSDALNELDSVIAKNFESRGGVMVDDAVTPMAAKMAKELDSFKAGETPSKAAGVLPSSPAGDVGTMRKRLLAIRNSAATSEDQRAAKAIYDSFIDWEVVAAEKAGNIEAAALARTARDATKQLHQIFDGPKGSAGAQILAKVLEKTDTPEGIVNALFTGPNSNTKNGTLTALNHLKAAYDTYLEPAAAKQAWDDIRLAYWLKFVGDKGNDVKTPGNLANAIKSMMGSQPTIVKTLYSREEIDLFRRVAAAMEDIRKKNPNTSWSAIGVGQLMKDIGGVLLQAIGWNSPIARTVAAPVTKMFSGQYGATSAKNAFGNLQGANLPAISPSFGGYGGAIGSQSQQ
jgi:hypothetical protein